ncbi:MAG: hypothetical protein J2P18_02780, partial [Nocardia sp.]|nr:hypothetical protein [Nocardia sp.]
GPAPVRPLEFAGAPHDPDGTEAAEGEHSEFDPATMQFVVDPDGSGWQPLGADRPPVRERPTDPITEMDGPDRGFAAQAPTVLPLTPGALRLLNKRADGIEVRAISLDLVEGCAVPTVRAAVEALLQRHPMLWARLHRSDEGVRFEIPAPADRIDHGWWHHVSDDSSDRAVGVAAAELDPETGRNIRFVLTDESTPEDPESLLTLVIVANGLVVDDESWRVIIDEVSRACSNSGHELADTVDPTGLSRLLADRAIAAETTDQLSWWNRALPPADPEQPDHPSGRGRVTVSLTAEGSAALATVARRYYATVDEVLVAGLATVLLPEEGADLAIALGPVLRLSVDARGLDPAVGKGVVGAFTTSYPVRLGLRQVDIEEVFVGGRSAGTVIEQIHRQLRAVPAHGVDLGLLRHRDPDAAAAVAALASGRVGFRYRDLRPAAVFPEAAEADLLLDVTVEATDDGLTARFDFAPVLALEDVRALVEKWIRVLGGFAEHGATGGVRGAGAHDPA